MRSIRPLFTARRGRSARRGTSPVLAAVGLASALALTATACGSGDDHGGRRRVGVRAGQRRRGDGKITIPDDIKDKLKEHGIDLDKWKNGAWKNWDKDDWLREAEDYVNPIIEGLWDPDRMRDAEDPDKSVDESDLAGDQGVTDPTPRSGGREGGADARTTPTRPRRARCSSTPPRARWSARRRWSQDPANPGKSNLVWTAGHCVHAGKKGGWYRNIAFVPSYNDSGMSAAELETATKEEVAPYGVWWGDWAQTSDQWIEQGGPDGRRRSPVRLRRHPCDAGGGQRRQVAGGDGRFGAAGGLRRARPCRRWRASRRPATRPRRRSTARRCTSARTSRGGCRSTSADPTMYRIGCTMTGGSSGGGWVATGRTASPRWCPTPRSAR